MTDAEHLRLPRDPERCYPGCPHTSHPLPSEPDLAALAEAIHETCDWEHYMGHEPSERDDMLAASLLPALERRGWSRAANIHSDAGVADDRP